MHKTHTINKFLIVGHEDSAYRGLLDLLKYSGIENASSLKKENITPEEISPILLSNHRVKNKQLKVSPVWNGLALDLILSNLNKRSWCWADPKAAHLLDFWKNIDNDIGFLLVYDDPRSFAKKLLSKDEYLSPKDIKSKFKEWHTYNETLLNFFYRNSEKTLLIHSEHIEKNTQEYMHELSTKVGKKLVPTTVNTLETEEKHTDAHLTYLINDLVESSKFTSKIYTELQSVATLPYFEVASKKMTVFKAFAAYKNHTQAISKDSLENTKKLLSPNLIDKEENDLLLSQLHQVQEEFEKKYLEMEDTQKTIEEQVNKEKEYNLEQTQLLAQLHLVQEELEKYYLENQRLKEKKAEEKRHYGAAERIKAQLSYRLGAKMIEKSHSFFGLLGLPFSLKSVHKQYKKDMLERKGKKLPPIESYADAYEAERVKNHLSYTLGQTMVKTMKTPFGIFVLPFKLSATYKAYKKNRA